MYYLPVPPGNSLYVYYLMVYIPPGNGLMLTVLLKRRGLLRITEIYLLHLGLADLMLLATFPFALAQVSLGVVFGDVLCKLIGLMNRLNFLCGSLLLACIGFDRYLAIVHAITSLQSRRPRNVHLTCLALWLVCLALSVPNAVFLSVGESPIDPTQLSCFFHSHGLHANNWDLTVGSPQPAQHLISLIQLFHWLVTWMESLSQRQGVRPGWNLSATDRELDRQSKEQM